MGGWVDMGCSELHWLHIGMACAVRSLRRIARGPASFRLASDSFSGECSLWLPFSAVPPYRPFHLRESGVQLPPTPSFNTLQGWNGPQAQRPTVDDPCQMQQVVQPSGIKLVQAHVWLAVVLARLCQAYVIMPLLDA